MRQHTPALQTQLPGPTMPNISTDLTVLRPPLPFLLCRPSMEGQRVECRHTLVPSPRATGLEGPPELEDPVSLWEAG